MEKIYEKMFNIIIHLGKANQIMSCHYKRARRAKIRNSGNIKCWER
jgi:hypothetical protein